MSDWQHWADNPPPREALVIVKRPDCPAFGVKVMRPCENNPAWNCFGAYWTFSGIERAFAEGL